MQYASVENMQTNAEQETIICHVSFCANVANVCSGLMSKTTISEPFPELYFWICTQGIKVQQKIQNNV